MTTYRIEATAQTGKVCELAGGMPANIAKQKAAKFKRAGWLNVTIIEEA